MNYFKIISNNEVIGVGHAFLKWNTKRRAYYYCDMAEGQIAQNDLNETYYHDGWLKAIPDGAVSVNSAEIVLIGATEYDELYELLSDGEEVPVPDEPEPPTHEPEPDPDVEPERPMTVQEMREKIAEQESQIEMLTDCLLEMSEIVYGGEL